MDLYGIIDQDPPHTTNVWGHGLTDGYRKWTVHGRSRLLSQFTGVNYPKLSPEPAECTRMLLFYNNIRIMLLQS